MNDRAPSPERLAELYDLFNPWGPSDDFYLGLVMAAEAVLDVGCGTGVLLHRAREAGHTGRLCGLDPDEARLSRARRRSDVEWVLSDAASASWDREFDLAVMASHAFQVFVEDDDLRASLAVIRSALVDGGVFAFETRNPSARAWEGWTPEAALEAVDAAGATVRVHDQGRDPGRGRRRPGQRDAHQPGLGPATHRAGQPAVPRRGLAGLVPGRRRPGDRGAVRRLGRPASP
jgi:SAM-dependent methyltransferase